LNVQTLLRKRRRRINTDIMSEPRRFALTDDASRRVKQIRVASRPIISSLWDRLHRNRRWNSVSTTTEVWRAFIRTHPIRRPRPMTTMMMTRLMPKQCGQLSLQEVQVCAFSWAAAAAAGRGRRRHQARRQPRRAQAGFQEAEKERVVDGCSCEGLSSA